MGAAGGEEPGALRARYLALHPPRPLGRPVASAWELAPHELKAMLAREDELRLSPETRAAFAQYRREGRGEEGMSAVVDDVQRTVAREFGLSDDVGFEALRCAHALLPGDPEVTALSLYRRHNRCVDGVLAAGHAAPDVAIWPVCAAAQATAKAALGAGRGEEDCDGPVRLLDLLSAPRAAGGGGRGRGGGGSSCSRGGGRRALVVVAGSYT